MYNPPVNVGRYLLGENEDQTEREQDRVPISGLDVEKAQKVLHNKKAVGICEIPPELLKQGGPVKVGVMTRMFNVLVEEQRVPAEWKKAIIIPFFKTETGSPYKRV